jgi:hypothetical protein
MSSCGAYYHEFSESSSACLLKGKCPFSLTNAIELLLKASAEWLCLGAPRLRVTHEHYCCAATFQATPVLRELANTSKPKHGLIPIRCCFNVIALKHRSSVCLGGLKINRSIATRYNQLANSFIGWSISAARYWLKFVHAA